jgi:hypothetical protein
VDDIMQDSQSQQAFQVEVSETLCRQTMVHASEAGAVVAEQLVAQREISVSSPQEQITVSEEREVRAVQAFANSSSGFGSDLGAPSVHFMAAQVARRALRWDQISGEVELDEEELSRWQLAVDRVVPEGPEPDASDPAGETLSQPGGGPSSLCPRDDLQWRGRAGLTGSSVPQLGSSSVLLLEDRHDRSEGPSGDDGIDEDAGPSEQLSQTQVSAISSQGERTGRRSYAPMELWEPRFRKEYEAFKAARGDRRFEIWLGWSKEEQRLVYLASSLRSRKLQLRWKGQVKHMERLAWARDHGDEEEEDE